MKLFTSALPNVLLDIAPDPEDITVTGQENENVPANEDVPANENDTEEVQVDIEETSVTESTQTSALPVARPIAPSLVVAAIGVALLCCVALLLIHKAHKKAK